MPLVEHADCKSAQGPVKGSVYLLTLLEGPPEPWMHLSDRPIESTKVIRCDRGQSVTYDLAEHSDDTAGQFEGAEELLADPRSLQRSALPGASTSIRPREDVRWHRSFVQVFYTGFEPQKGNRTVEKPFTVSTPVQNWPTWPK